jgi:hypothetical protein
MQWYIQTSTAQWFVGYDVSFLFLFIDICDVFLFNKNVEVGNASYLYSGGASFASWLWHLWYWSFFSVCFINAGMSSHMGWATAF